MTKRKYAYPSIDSNILRQNELAHKAYDMMKFDEEQRKREKKDKKLESARKF